MLNLLIALAATGAAQAIAPQAPAAPARALSSIPGVTVKYYDVTGNTTKDVEKSMAAVRKLGADGKPIPAGTAWHADVKISKRTEGETCKITGATVSFTGSAELPRLNAPKADPRFLAAWKSFASDLEADAAADLGYIYDNLGQIEKAVLASSCDGAAAAMDAASQQLRAQARTMSAQRAAERAAAQAKRAAEAAKKAR